jgi:hypothetical protein
MTSPALTVHGIPVSDVDSHYTEPGDLWTSRAPKKYEKLVPRVEKEPNGQGHWVVSEDSVMFETDFPHPTCLYPKAQEHITEVLTDLDPGIRCKVLHDTAERVYHLPAPPTV